MSQQPDLHSASNTVTATNAPYAAQPTPTTPAEIFSAEIFRISPIDTTSARGYSQDRCTSDPTTTPERRLMSSQPNNPGEETTLSAVPEAERETIIVIPGDRSAVSVWTNIPKHIRAFRKKQSTSNQSTTSNQTSKVRTRRSGFHGSTEWVEFEIDEADFNPAQAVKRNSNLSPEQRRQAAERLANVRKNG